GAYGCIQPTGSSWSFDTYQPSTPVTVLPASLFATPTATAGGSAAASISLLNTGQYQLAFTLPQGPASTVPGPVGPAPTLAPGTISTGSAAVTFTPNGTGSYLVNFTLPSFDTTSPYTWTAQQTFSSGISAANLSAGPSSAPASVAN